MHQKRIERESASEMVAKTHFKNEEKNTHTHSILFAVLTTPIILSMKKERHSNTHAHAHTSEYSAKLK